MANDFFISYFPHPAFWAAAALAGFGFWALKSARREGRAPHPKTSRPLRLGVESVLLGLCVVAAILAMIYYYGLQLDRGNIVFIAISGASAAGAYFVCPYLGYNLLWNKYYFGAGSTPFVLLALLFTFIWMGLQAQFGF